MDENTIAADGTEYRVTHSYDDGLISSAILHTPCGLRLGYDEVRRRDYSSDTTDVHLYRGGSRVTTLKTDDDAQASTWVHTLVGAPSEPIEYDYRSYR